MRQYHRGNGEPIVETHKLSGKRFAAVSDNKSHGGFDVRIRYADGQNVSGVVKGQNYRVGLKHGIGIAKKQIASITLRKMEPQSVEVK